MESVSSLKHPPLAVLPNGALLKYRFKYEKGKPWRTRASPGLLASVEEIGFRPNGNAAILVGESDSGQYLIFADFDKLPAYYEGKERSWAVFEADLRKTYGDRALVFRTRKGRCKVGFVIEVPDQIPLDLIVIPTLQEILDEELSAVVDRSPSALSCTFITKQLMAELPRLPELPVIPACLSGLPDYSRNQYRLSDDPIKSDSLRFFFEASTPVIQGVLKFCLATPGLVRSGGFNISQSKLAATLVYTQKTISKALKCLVSEGYLIVIDKSYVPFKKAKTYKAIGALGLEILEIFDATTFSGSRNAPITPPANGEWNRFLGKLLLKNKELDLDSWLKLCSTIPNINDDRLDQAKRWWKSANRRASKFVRRK